MRIYLYEYLYSFDCKKEIETKFLRLFQNMLCICIEILCRWEDNIKMNLRQVGCEDVNLSRVGLEWRNSLVTMMNVMVSEG